jgi:hypothetical protein
MSSMLTEQSIVAKHKNREKKCWLFWPLFPLAYLRDLYPFFLRHSPHFIQFHLGMLNDIISIFC